MFLPVKFFKTAAYTWQHMEQATWHSASSLPPQDWRAEEQPKTIHWSPPIAESQKRRSPARWNHQLRPPPLHSFRFSPARATSSTTAGGRHRHPRPRNAGGVPQARALPRGLLPFRPEEPRAVSRLPLPCPPQPASAPLGRRNRRGHRRLRQAGRRLLLLFLRRRRRRFPD